MEGLGTLFFGLLVGIFFIWLGLKGRKEKFERELDMSIPADELPGVFEGTVQKGWWMFILFGIFYITIGLVEFAKALN